MLRSESVKHQFSRAANHYQENAVVQYQAAKELSKLFSISRCPKSILDLGCGTGFFTRETAEVFPEANIMALDVSSGMIETAKEYSKEFNSIEFIVENFWQFNPAKEFDLVVSNAAMQWFGDLTLVCDRVKKFLAPNGLFVFSIMTEGTLRELREAREVINPDKSAAVILPSAQTVLDSLSISGFVIEQTKTLVFQREFPTVESVFGEIKSLGLTGGAIKADSLLNRRELKEVFRKYQDLARTARGGVFLRYELELIRAKL
jgi:malonyl-CoA O-methyltransferase